MLSKIINPTLLRARVPFLNRTIISRVLQTSSVHVTDKPPAAAPPAAAAAAAPPAAAAAAPPAAPADPGNRLKRLEPGAVRWGFVPEEWFAFVRPKTGVTGFYTFCVTFGTYLCSKEIYVMEHDYYVGLSVIALSWLTVVYVGPPFANMIDKQVDAFEKDWTADRENHVKSLEDSVANELKCQWSSEGQLMLLAAKRENVDLQLETNYRERLKIVNQTIKSMLDYQVEVVNINDKFWHRNMVQWIHDSVVASISPEVAANTIDQCLKDLEPLAAVYHKTR